MYLRLLQRIYFPWYKQAKVLSNITISKGIKIPPVKSIAAVYLIGEIGIFLGPMY